MPGNAAVADEDRRLARRAGLPTLSRGGSRPNSIADPPPGPSRSSASTPSQGSTRAMSAPGMSASCSTATPACRDPLIAVLSAEKGLVVGVNGPARESCRSCLSHARPPRRGARLAERHDRDPQRSRGIAAGRSAMGREVGTSHCGRARSRARHRAGNTGRMRGRARRAARHDKAKGLVMSRGSPSARPHAASVSGSVSSARSSAPATCANSRPIALPPAAMPRDRPDLDHDAADSRARPHGGRACDDTIFRTVRLVHADDEALQRKARNSRSDRRVSRSNRTTTCQGRSWALLSPVKVWTPMTATARGGSAIEVGLDARVIGRSTCSMRQARSSSATAHCPARASPG